MSGLASLLIDSSSQRTLTSFAKRHAWAFPPKALCSLPSLSSVLSVALLDDLSAVARMSSAINFFSAAPCDLPALRFLVVLVDCCSGRALACARCAAARHAHSAPPSTRGRLPRPAP